MWKLLLVSLIVFGCAVESEDGNREEVSKTEYLEFTGSYVAKLTRSISCGDLNSNCDTVVTEFKDVEYVEFIDNQFRMIKIKNSIITDSIVGQYEHVADTLFLMNLDLHKKSIIYSEDSTSYQIESIMLDSIPDLTWPINEYMVEVDCLVFEISNDLPSSERIDKTYCIPEYPDENFPLN